MLLVASPCLEAVTCDTCKDTIGGCTGGASCPLLKDPTDNAAALASSSSTATLDVTKLLPPELLCTFTKTVMETLSAVARAPKGGGSVDLGSSSISAASGVVKAAINGFCTWEEAGLELAGRLEAASDASAVTKLSAALTLLKSTQDKAGTVAQAAVQSGVGLFTFVWAKIGSHLDAVQAGTVRILAKSAGSSSSTDLTAKLRRPKSEAEFHYMLFIFIRVVAALGVSLYLVHDFLSKVVFNTLQLLREDFRVAHELLLIYFRAVETDPTKMLVGKVQADTDYGMHAARVGGYNASVRANGEELTVAHGLWRSKAHNRYHRWSDLEVAGIPAAMVGEDNSYLEDDGAGEGRPFQVRARAVRLNQSPRGGVRGGRAGRGGRGRTGTTTEAPTAVADTGAGVGVVAVEEEFETPDGNPHGLPADEPDGDGLPDEAPVVSPSPRLSPPPGWTVAADGRFMPPPRLPNAAPQVTIVAAWAVHRQLTRLASALVLDAQPRARTRHGA